MDSKLSSDSFSDFLDVYNMCLLQKIVTIVFLVATILFVENAVAQAQWHNASFAENYSNARYDAFGVANGEATFSNSGAKSIGNLYSAGGGACNNNSGLLTVERFWVTTTTLGNMNKFKSNGLYTPSVNVEIKEFTLQVGHQAIDVSGNRNFGTPDQVVNNVTLTATSVSDGFTTVDNSNFGKITNPGNNQTSWGQPEKYSVANFGTINNAEISGGTLYNGGSIGNLTYYGGTYENKGGTIDLLNVATTLQGTSWGTVDNLRFDSNGDGLVIITGFLGEDDKLGFKGLKVKDHADFTHGKIMLDMSDVVSSLIKTTRNDMSAWRTEDWATLFYGEFGSEMFNVSSLFGAASFDGLAELNLGVIWNDAGYSFDIVREGEWRRVGSSNLRTLRQNQ